MSAVLSWKSPLMALRHHRAAMFALLAVLALAGWLLPRWLLGPQLALGSVMQREFGQTLVASGRVETPHRVDIGVQITGTVLSVPVAEGQSVAAAAKLIELESAKLRAAVSQAEVAVAQAQARLRQLREVQAPVAEQALR